MKISNNDSCIKCQLPDSIDHLFSNCEYSATLWTEAEKWITIIGFLNYEIDNKIKILDDRKKTLFSISYC